MTRINLYARGEFLAVVEIPPFEPGLAPDVVHWCGRAFVRAPRLDPRAADYIEARTARSITPAPGLPRPRPREDR